MSVTHNVQYGDFPEHTYVYTLYVIIHLNVRTSFEIFIIFILEMNLIFLLLV